MFAGLATNAILHKDYSRPDYVGLYVCADRMTFVNHNRPLPPVTIEGLNERESFDERGCVNSELKVCLVKPDFRFGTAVGILDQDKVTRRTACTAQGSGSWQSRPTSSST